MKKLTFKGFVGFLLWSYLGVLLISIMIGIGALIYAKFNINYATHLQWTGQTFPVIVKNNVFNPKVFIAGVILSNTIGKKLLAKIVR